MRSGGRKGGHETGADGAEPAIIAPKDWNISPSPVPCLPCLFKLGLFVSSTPPSTSSMRSSVGLAPRFALPGDENPMDKFVVSTSRSGTAAAAVGADIDIDVSALTWSSKLDSGALRFRESSPPPPMLLLERASANDGEKGEPSRRA